MNLCSLVLDAGPVPCPRWKLKVSLRVCVVDGQDDVVQDDVPTLTPEMTNNLLVRVNQIKNQDGKEPTEK